MFADADVRGLARFTGVGDGRYHTSRALRWRTCYFPFFVYIFVEMQFQAAAYSSPDISIEATIGSTIFGDKVSIFSLCHFTESVDMNYRRLHLETP